jgi:hypothetical protein
VLGLATDFVARQLKKDLTTLAYASRKLGEERIFKVAIGRASKKARA